MQKLTIFPLSKTDTNILKGIGILIIIFHNFLSWVAPNTGENEANFSASRVIALFKGIADTPLESFNLFFDFFGPYGLAIFFFLSGYGLTIAYQQKSEISYLTFIKNRFIKLYPAFILSVLLLLLWYVVRGEIFSGQVFKSIAYKLFLVSNFIQDEHYALNGPWWFFVAIMQFYFVFPFIIKGYKKYGSKFLWIVAITGFLIRLISLFGKSKLLLFVPYSFIPYLFEISLGIYLASVNGIIINKQKLTLIAIVSLLIFCAGNYIREFWFFASFAFLILFLISYPTIKVALVRIPFLNKLIIFFGSISYYLFLVHGPLRVPLVCRAELLSPLGKLVILLLFIILSIIFANFLKWVEEKLFSFMRRKKENKIP
jgi:peptidoglycan/LPS O-acetylase OafA/YrhL